MAIDEDLHTLQEKLSSLGRSIPTKVDAAQYPLSTRVPYEVECLRWLLIARTYTLIQDALRLFIDDRRMAALVLARSAMETTAMLFYLNKKTARVIEDEDEDEGFSDYLQILDRMHLGGTRDMFPNDPIRVGRAFDHMRRDQPKYYELYLDLCDYAHPNWSGTVAPHSRRERLGTIMYIEDRNREIPRVFFLAPTITSLIFIEDMQQDWSNFFPRFLDVCEKLAPSDS